MAALLPCQAGVGLGQPPARGGAPWGENGGTSDPWRSFQGWDYARLVHPWRSRREALLVEITTGGETALGRDSGFHPPARSCLQD